MANIIMFAQGFTYFRINYLFLLKFKLKVLFINTSENPTPVIIRVESPTYSMQISLGFG